MLGGHGVSGKLGSKAQFAIGLRRRAGNALTARLRGPRRSCLSDRARPLDQFGVRRGCWRFSAAVRQSLGRWGVAIRSGIRRCADARGIATFRSAQETNTTISAMGRMVVGDRSPLWRVAQPLDCRSPGSPRTTPCWVRASSGALGAARARQAHSSISGTAATISATAGISGDRCGRAGPRRGSARRAFRARA